jgi:hypothetical protein
MAFWRKKVSFSEWLRNVNGACIRTEVSEAKKADIEGRLDSSTIERIEDMCLNYRLAVVASDMLELLMRRKLKITFEGLGLVNQQATILAFSDSGYENPEKEAKKALDDFMTWYSPAVLTGLASDQPDRALWLKEAFAQKFVAGEYQSESQTFDPDRKIQAEDIKWPAIPELAMVRSVKALTPGQDPTGRLYGEYVAASYADRVGALTRKAVEDASEGLRFSY